jgi:hypothetical protein
MMIKLCFKALERDDMELETREPGSSYGKRSLGDFEERNWDEFEERYWLD